MNINYNPQPREYKKLQGDEYLNKDGDAGAQMSHPIEKFIPDEDIKTAMKLVQNYPLSENDIRRERYNHLATFLMNTHDGCFQQCTTPNNFTFLSVKEGKCFRNCITKTTYHAISLK